MAIFSKNVLRGCLLMGLAGACLVATSSHAHGLWFAQRSGDIALVYGEGGDDLDAAKRLPLIRHVAAYDHFGKSVSTSLTAQGKLVVADLSANPAILTAVLDNGIWTKTEDGLWHKKPKNELQNVSRSSQNFKYAVHLLKPHDTLLSKLPDQLLQLIPLSAIPLNRGEKLRLRILFDGKPFPGAKVVTDFVGDPDAPPLMSNTDGEVELIVRNQGLNVIVAEVETAPTDARLTESVSHVASLSFRIKHAGE